MSHSDREAGYGSFSKLDMPQVPQKGDVIVKSLVNIITVDIPDTFKKMFSRGQSMKNLKPAPSGSNNNKSSLSSLKDLEAEKSQISNKGFVGLRNKPRGYSMIDVSTKRSSLKNKVELEKICESPFLPVKVESRNSIVDSDKDHVNDTSISFKSDFKPKLECNTLLKQSFRNSADDHLKPFDLVDSPTINPGVKRYQSNNCESTNLEYKPPKKSVFQEYNSLSKFKDSSISGTTSNMSDPGFVNRQLDRKYSYDAVNLNPRHLKPGDTIYFKNSY